MVRGVVDLVMKSLLLATSNRGKALELAEILRDVPFDLVSLEDVSILHAVEETGLTFEENAVLKARAYASFSGLIALADDSGLEVDALDGRPGVTSARYGSPDLSDEGRVQLLLHELVDIPWEQRTARFKCVIAISTPLGEVDTVEGVMEGVIQYCADGNNGFGYDPIFYLPDKGCTTAQLSMKEKNLLSHRGLAARAAAKILRNKVFDDRRKPEASVESETVHLGEDGLPKC